MGLFEAQLVHETKRTNEILEALLDEQYQLRSMLVRALDALVEAGKLPPPVR